MSQNYSEFPDYQAFVKAADLLIKIGEEKLQDWIDRVASRERDCYSAVGSILEGVVAQPKEQNGGDA